jgi:hypothetical protein
MLEQLCGKPTCNSYVRNLRNWRVHHLPVSEYYLRQIYELSLNPNNILFAMFSLSATKKCIVFAASLMALCITVPAIFLLTGKITEWNLISAIKIGDEASRSAAIREIERRRLKSAVPALLSVLLERTGVDYEAAVNALRVLHVDTSDAALFFPMLEAAFEPDESELLANNVDTSLRAESRRERSIVADLGSALIDCITDKAGDYELQSIGQLLKCIRRMRLDDRVLYCKLLLDIMLRCPKRPNAGPEGIAEDAVVLIVREMSKECARCLREGLESREPIVRIWSAVLLSDAGYSEFGIIEQLAVYLDSPIERIDSIYETDRTLAVLGAIRCNVLSLRRFPDLMVSVKSSIERDLSIYNRFEVVYAETILAELSD